MDNEIKVGDYIIIQRQIYTKLHKLKAHGTAILGKDIIEMDNVVGRRFFDAFRMESTGKRTYTLENVKEINSIMEQEFESSGKDNRDIIDDGSSQTLSKEEISKLREESRSSSDIVQKLIDNSKTFSSKTEFSQRKYLKKKEKKYFEYIQVRKPSVRLLAQMFYRQEPSKVLGIRIDDLSQILTLSNVQADGNFILYDSGTSGLMSAALMNAIGANTTGRLIHMHPGNECQKNAFLAMQFPQEQAERCVNVNVYSVLRCYYQNKGAYCEVEGFASEDSTTEAEAGKGVKRKLDEEEGATKSAKKPCWQFDNEKACRILNNKVDGLVITAKEHPVSVVKGLADFLDKGRPLVIFSVLREPLQEVYVYLKGRCDFIFVRLTGNFMRSYQVLPERTHPEMNMNSGGYVLSAYKISL